MLLFLKKLLNEKVFKTSFPIKGVIFIFVAKCLLPFVETWALEMFLQFFQKITAFFEKIAK